MTAFVKGMELRYPAVIDFYGEYCSPCKMMEPILQALEEELPNVHFYKVNVLETLGYEDIIDFSIVSIPTIVLKTETKQLLLTNKTMPKANLKKLIEEGLC